MAGLEEKIATIERKCRSLCVYNPTIILGSGSFGTCVKAKYARPDLGGYVYAAVKISKHENADPEDATQMIKDEVAVLKHVAFQNVVELLDHGTTRDRHGYPFGYLVLALASHGSLGDWLEKGTKPCSRMRIIYQILRGLSYLHAKTIFHRDLKPDNILVHRDKEGHWVLKITDFGLATREVRAEDPCGTIMYLAPEVYTRPMPYSTGPADVFAVGVILVELLAPRHRLPWSNQAGLVAWVNSEGYRKAAGKQVLFVDFFQSCVTGSVSRRKTALQLQEMASKMMFVFEAEEDVD